MIWRNAGFGGLRSIREYLLDFEPRFDPTVIPVAQELETSQENNELLKPASPSRALAEPTGRYYSVADYHAMYMTGELTPLAVAKAILPLIRRDISPPGEHSLAWFDVRVDLVLAAAEASTLRYKRKCPIGPLDGVPTSVKDEYSMDGYKTCLGSLNDYTDEALPGESITNWCVRKMEDAGAIILGKLAMNEFGLGTYSLFS